MFGYRRSKIKRQVVLYETLVISDKVDIKIQSTIRDIEGQNDKYLIHEESILLIMNIVNKMASNHVE